MRKEREGKGGRGKEEKCCPPTSPLLDTVNGVFVFGLGWKQTNRVVMLSISCPSVPDPAE